MKLNNFNEMNIEYTDLSDQKNTFLFLSIFIFSGISLCFSVWFANFVKEPEVKGTNITNEQSLAIEKAYEIYNEYKASGLNMAEGPCLTNNLIDGWVLDIAHNPREDRDNEAENQCLDYLLGEKEHFVELTPEGELIRAM